jgi:DNA-binding GntR family transcriptional regulator
MPVPTTAECLVRRRLRKDDVFDQLLAAILDGTLSPGERLRDPELQEWLGVSRTPIRLALERLDALHLVETRSNRYTKVSAARPDRIPQAIEVMCGLWALAARLSIGRLDCAEAARGVVGLRQAARVCTGDDAATVPQTVERMREALFFFSIHSGNPLLRDLVVKIGADLRFQLGLPGAAIDVRAFADVFERLAEAVESRDADAAVAVFDDLRAGRVPSARPADAVSVLS